MRHFGRFRKFIQFWGNARIDTGNGMAAPVFNLEPVYEEAQRTGSFDRILENLEEKISEVLRDMPQIGPEDLASYDQAKENLIMQVIPVKGNEERLVEMPHRNMEDMAVVYRVMMETGHTMLRREAVLRCERSGEDGKAGGNGSP